MKKNKVVLCLMHKHQFGDSLKPISAEYNGIFNSLKKIFKKTYFFETHNRKYSIYENNIKIIEKAKKIKPDIIFCHQSSYEIYKEGINSSALGNMFNKYRLKVSFLEYDKAVKSFTI